MPARQLPARQGPAAGALQADAQLLAAAVREAGTIAMSFFRQDPKTWDKGDDDPVTEADLAIDRHLREALSGARPDYGWLSEESADDKSRLDRRAVWIVDPIDGTRAFVQGREHFSISVALTLDGAPVLAAVFAPATDEFYAASAGHGATCNGTTIRVSDRPDLSSARILTSRGIFNRLRHHAEMPDADWFYRNSIAYRLVLAAAGRYDASVTLSEKSEWDVAAGDLIVREAGSVATDMRGKPLVYNQPLPRLDSIVAAPPQLHGPLMTAIGRELAARETGTLAID